MPVLQPNDHGLTKPSALLVCLISLLLPGHAAAQCGPGGCTVAPDHYEWRRSPDPADQHRAYLYRNGVQIGGWDTRAQYYRALASDGQWSEPIATAPFAPPPRAQETWRLNGVDASKLNGRDSAPSYRINGHGIPPAGALDALKLDDDSKKLWLVIIGEKDVRDRVVKDLQTDPALADFNRRVRVWSVPPDHFSLHDRDTGKPMFDTSGQPSIYVMAPGGEVLAQQNGYRGGEDLRRADPDANKKDEAKRPVPANRASPVGLAVTGVLVVIVIALNRKGPTHADH